MPDVCTWAAGLAGTCWFILDEATDLPGLYILIFKQWKYHGSGFPPADANRLPIIRNWQQISSEQLLQLAIEYMRTYNCFAVCVSESQREYTKLCSLLLADLKDINNGGKTVPGLPNSPKTGIVRGNGIVRGRLACHIRNTYDVHKMWDVACQATERPEQDAMHWLAQHMRCVAVTQLGVQQRPSHSNATRRQRTDNSVVLRHVETSLTTPCIAYRLQVGSDDLGMGFLDD